MVHRYINGAHYDEVPMSSPAGTMVGSELLLGAGADLNSSQFFKGQIDDIRIYNRALGDSELLQLHHFEKPPPPVAPEITAQPIDQNATVGSTVSFTVEANGTNSNYQWQKTTNMPADENNTWLNTGSNAATLTINNVQLVDNNSGYRVTVSNSAGSATGNPARLTVFDPSNLPVITRSLLTGWVIMGNRSTLT